MTATTKSVRLGPFTPGMNNRRPDFKLDDVRDRRKVSYLRSLVNADITAEGPIKRRQGYARVVPGLSCRSLWKSAAGRVYYADGTQLILLTDGFAGTALRSDLAPGQPVSYANVGADTYWSDGVLLRRLDAAGDHPAGVPMLLADPTITIAAGGSLPAGYYSLAFTQTNADGEESGSTVPTEFAVPAGGSISISGLPAAFLEGVTGLSIYMSPVNGDILYRIAVLPAAQATYEVQVLPSYGPRCSTLLLAPMPAGRLVRYLNGRLLVAQGNVLYYSEPYAPALRNPAKNYIVFNAPITMLEPCDKGFYIAADVTYWVAGDIATAELDHVLPYGAVYGAGGEVPNSNSVWWMSMRGVVRGDENGKVENLQEDDVAVEAASNGAVLFREQDGMKQALASMFGAQPTVMVARSWMDAEVIRKGTTL